MLATQPGDRNYVAANTVSISFTVASATHRMLTVASVAPHFVVAGSAAQDITLRGTNFLPSITATYAGAAHAITYVDSTTVILPLTAGDLATWGIQSIILANPDPDNGAAAINLPVLYETDAMLARSQLAAGNQARLRRLIEKGRNGEPVTIATVGGSITAGVGASDGAHSYARLMQDWWNETFPDSASKLVNAGISGTASDYGSLRLQRDVLPSSPDLVIVEFAVNDASSSLSDTYEGVLRQLLNAPSHPAVVLLFMMRYQPLPSEPVTAEPWQSVIGDHYNLPMVSFYDAVNPELQDGNITIAQIGPDGVHPSDLGHAYIAHFLEQDLQAAINRFPPGTASEEIPATETPIYSSNFEFTSLEEGIGTWGAPLSPDGNQGWTAVSTSPRGLANFPSEGLTASSPGSTLDFMVTGREILIGYWQYNGAMGQVSVSVDGVVTRTLDGFVTTAQGAHIMTRVASGLEDGPHHVHLELLDTRDGGSTGKSFYLLCVGAGGVL
jgi:lysophospholipase L1-like esterase